MVISILNYYLDNKDCTTLDLMKYIKGPDFATKRLKQHYKRFYHKYRNNYGWVLKCDIHHFFESINHNILF